MDTRSRMILEAAVREYIKSGEPVSSKELTISYDFGIKDASVRSELNRLTKDGFLSQMHVSGGRVPTDKGYQFFVAQTLDDVVTSRKILDHRYGALAGNLRSGKLREFVSGFSDEMRLLGVGKKEKEKESYKSGLQGLVNSLDVVNKQNLREIVRDFEMLDRRLEEMRVQLFKVLRLPEVFIGRSPITKSKNLSVVMDSFNTKDGKVLVALIGQKRMDYNKTLEIFKDLKAELKG